MQKYILQTEFECSQPCIQKANSPNRDKAVALKFMNVNFFKQQMGQLARPCSMMVEKVEQQFKTCVEEFLSIEQNYKQQMQK